jgi:D-alanyl-D-alanine carboxypeptidase/D-alanyl-D-alanine-endopeptidase (penicillin-binding protein 4)
MRVHKIILIVSVLFSSSAFSSDGLWSKDIDTLLEKNGLSKDQYGIEIRSADSTQNYYSANSKQPFNPASTMKILVSIASLEQLGPHYKFATLLKKQGKDLCLVGQGDPSLVYEDLFLLTEQTLREPSFGKTAIDHIFVDESFFPITRQYDEDFDGDGQRSFTAPLSSLSLNYNSVTIFVKPGAVGEKPEVYTEPRSSYFVIRNQAKTISTGAKTIGATIQSKGDKIEVTVSGQISTKDSSIIYRAIPEPALYAGSIFKDLLQRAGVTISGSVEKKNCGLEFAELSRFQSKPLSQIVMGMNKFSNNFIAETLMYHLGEKPTSKSGLEKLHDWTVKKNLPLTHVNIENASGLSRDNSVTPSFLWGLYSYGRNNFKTSAEMMASLPMGGLDGTLRRRFQSESLQGLVRAKSGSLRNTVSLVGSIQTAKKGELLFVFLFETRGKSMGQIQAIEEKILEKVAALGRN